MKRFKVELSGAIYANATVIVEALDETRAKDRALDMADNGEVTNWQVSDDDPDPNTITALTNVSELDPDDDVDIAENATKEVNHE